MKKISVYVIFVFLLINTVNAIDLTNLAAYYSSDNNNVSGTTHYDSHTTGSNATLINGLLNGSLGGANNQAFDYDGNNDRLSYSSGTLITNGGNAFTSCFYVNSTDMTDGASIYWAEGHTGTIQHVSLGQVGTDIRFFVRDDSNVAVATYYDSNLLNSNQTYFMCGTYDGTNTVNLYIDGVLANTTTGSSQGSLTISKGAFGALDYSTAPVYFLDGIIDDMSLWTTELNSDNITEINWSFYPFSAASPSTAPTVLTVTINNTLPLESEVISCFANMTDPNNSTFLANYTWLKNGAQYSTGQVSNISNATNTEITSLTSSDYTAGDNIICRIQAYDGSEYSASKDSSTATVQSALNITINSPTNQSFTYNENAIVNISTTTQSTCKYADNSTFDFDTQGTQFTNTNSTEHTFNINLTTLSTYNYWYKCQNTDGINKTSTEHVFYGKDKNWNNILLAIGDSITYNYSVSNASKFSTLITNHLSSLSGTYTGLTDVNNAVGGTCMTNTSGCAQPTMITRYQADIINYNPRFIWLQTNINDVPNSASATDYYNNMTTVVTALQTNSSNTTTIITSSLHPSSYVGSPWEQSKFANFNAEARKVAIQKEIPFIEFHYLLNHNSAYYSDQHHLNSAGHIFYNQTIVPVIQNPTNYMMTNNNFNIYQDCNNQITILNYTMISPTNNCAATTSANWLIIKNLTNNASQITSKTFNLERIDTPFTINITNLFTPSTAYIMQVQNSTGTHNVSFTSTGSGSYLNIGFNAEDNQNISFSLNLDITPPEISNIIFTSLNENKTYFGDVNSFNTSNLEGIHYMQLNFTLTDTGGIDINDYKIWYNAGGLNACATGNIKHDCYEGNSFIEFVNNSITSTFDGTKEINHDSFICSYTNTTTNMNVSCIIGEHYNPNIATHYEANLNSSNIKWQTGSDQQIKKNRLIRWDISDVNLPLNADQYTLNLEANYSNINTLPLDVHICNSTYTTGVVHSSANCVLVDTETPSDFHHDNHLTFIFTKNLIDTIGDFKYVVLENHDSSASNFYTIKTYKILNNSFTQKWEYTKDNGGSWINLADGYEPAINLNWYFDGTNSTTFNFKVESVDLSGNRGNSSLQTLNWSIDATNNYPPVINIYTPETNSYNKGTINVSWDIAEPNDDTTLTNITLVNGSTVQVINSSIPSTTRSILFDTTSYTDKNYNLTIKVCENSTTDLYCVTHTHNITIDNTNPFLNLSTPINTTYSASSIPLTFSISETNPDVCWYNLGGANTTINNCANTTFTPSSNGQYTLTMYVNDSAGNVVSQTSGTFTFSGTVIVDSGSGGGGGGGGSSTTPIGNDVTSPSNGTVKETTIFDNIIDFIYDQDENITFDFNITKDDVLIEQLAEGILEESTKIKWINIGVAVIVILASLGIIGFLFGGSSKKKIKNNKLIK